MRGPHSSGRWAVGKAIAKAAPSTSKWQLIASGQAGEVAGTDRTSGVGQSVGQVDNLAGPDEVWLVLRDGMRADVDPFLGCRELYR